MQFRSRGSNGGVGRGQRALGGASLVEVVFSVATAVEERDTHFKVQGKRDDEFHKFETEKKLSGQCEEEET